MAKPTSTNPSCQGCVYKHLAKNMKFNTNCFVVPVGEEIFQRKEEDLSEAETLQQVTAVCLLMSDLAKQIPKATPRVDIKGLEVLFRWMGMMLKGINKY